MKFTLVVLGAVFGLLFIAAGTTYLLTPQHEDGLELLIPMALLVGGAGGTLASLPLWFYLAYEPWNQLAASPRKSLLLGAVVVCVAVFSLVLSAFVAVGTYLVLR